MGQLKLMLLSANVLPKGVVQPTERFPLYRDLMKKLHPRSLSWLNYASFRDDAFIEENRISN
jgi:hypothetical protein